MSKLRLAACALALFALPRCAHDPLDTVSGEEEFNKQVDPEDKPRSAKKVKQEGEFKHESEEMELAQYHAKEEKEAFIHDKQETHEVKEGQHHRDLVLGRKSNTTAPAMQTAKPKDEAKPDKSEKGKDDTAEPASGDAHGNSSSTVTVTRKPKGEKAKKPDDEAAAPKDKEDNEEQGREDFDKKMKKEKKKKTDEFDN